MSDDLIARLRVDGALAGRYDAPAIQREAADEIERLREALIRERHGWQAEVERLRREVMRAGGVEALQGER